MKKMIFVVCVCLLVNYIGRLNAQIIKLNIVDDDVAKEIGDYEIGATFYKELFPPTDRLYVTQRETESYSNDAINFSYSFKIDACDHKKSEEFFLPTKIDHQSSQSFTNNWRVEIQSVDKKDLKSLCPISSVSFNLYFKYDDNSKEILYKFYSVNFKADSTPARAITQSPPFFEAKKIKRGTEPRV